MERERVDALVVFGATGDLAKLETYPALVSLVERGALDVPIIGVAHTGWKPAQLRDYAAASLEQVSATEVTIKFRAPARNVCGVENFHAMNELRFRVRPETAVDLTLAGKKPGIGARAQAEQLTFAQQPGSDPRPYDRLIGAALEGHQWLFAREDGVEACWRIVDPILGDAVPLFRYQPGTWKPAEADDLLPGGVAWHDPTR